EGQELRHRWPNHAACRLRRELEEAQARRGGLRLGQDDCRLRQGQGARAGAGRIPLHAGNGSLQPDPPAETDRPGRVKRPLGGAGPTPRSSPKARQTDPQAIRFPSDPNFNGLLGFMTKMVKSGAPTGRTREFRAPVEWGISRCVQVVEYAVTSNDVTVRRL